MANQAMIKSGRQPSANEPDILKLYATDRQLAHDLGKAEVCLIVVGRLSTLRITKIAYIANDLKDLLAQGVVIGFCRTFGDGKEIGQRVPYRNMHELRIYRLNWPGILCGVKETTLLQGVEILFGLWPLGQ